MIEVTFSCDTCEKSVRRKYKTMTALVQAGQPKTFRLYNGAVYCSKCRRKIMGPKKFAQNKKAAEARAERKRRVEEARRLEARGRRRIGQLHNEAYWAALNRRHGLGDT